MLNGDQKERRVTAVARPAMEAAKVDVALSNSNISLKASSMDSLHCSVISSFLYSVVSSSMYSSI